MESTLVPLDAEPSASPGASPDTADEVEMTLTEHLEELRRRIAIAAGAILLFSCVFFVFSDQILHVLLLPAGGMELNAFNLMDGAMIKIHVALFAGIVASFPIWGYHIYAYISPGLYDHERKAIVPPMIVSLVLFVVGALFGFYLLWGIVRALKDLFPSGVKLLPEADGYVSFVMFFLLACGLAFQLPTLLIILVRLRILSVSVLTKQRKIAYFALFAFAEIITPVSDPIVAPLTVMVPLLILYEVSILIARRIEANRLLVGDHV